MKVLNILNSDGVGGAEILLRRIIDLGCFDSKVLILWKHNNNQPGFWEGRNVSYITKSYLNFITLLNVLFKLPTAINNIEKDCIQSQLKGADIIIGLLLLLKRINKKSKFVVVIHNSYSFYYGGSLKNKIVGFVHKFLINRYADEVIGVSKQDVNRFENAFGKKYKVIENGIELKNVKFKEDFSVSNQKLKIVCVGNVKYRKGYDRIKNLKKFISESQTLKNFNIEFNIAGAIEDSRLKSEVELISDNNFTINFLGKVEDINSLLLDSDLFLSLSREEGLPISVLEANAIKLPFLISKIPAHNLIVQTDVKDFTLFADEYHLCLLLEKMFFDIELRKYVAHKQYEQVLNRFDFNMMMEKYCHIYSKEN